MLWNSETGIVTGETGMFLGKDRVNLLFPAEKILKVYNSTLNTVYEEGTDYVHTPGSDFLCAVPGSAMPVLPPEAVHPDPATAIIYPKEGANAISRGPNGKLLLFSAENFFAAHQVEIDYQVAEKTVFPEKTVLKAGQLPRFTSLLKNRKSPRITLIGDSISVGYNSTKMMDCPPYALPYIEQFAAELERRFQVRIELRNCAVNGSGCKQAFDIESAWLEKPADLFVIAYGMNDFCRIDSTEYRLTIQKIMEKMREAHPETEFLLVTSMSGNTLWQCIPPGKDEEFAAELKKLESETVAIADVQDLWSKFRERKDFYDMCGNGVNHPNDYGYRVYAKVLADLF